MNWLERRLGTRILVGQPDGSVRRVIGPPEFLASVGRGWFGECVFRDNEFELRDTLNFDARDLIFDRTPNGELVINGFIASELIYE